MIGIEKRLLYRGKTQNSSDPRWKIRNSNFICSLWVCELPAARLLKRVRVLKSLDYVKKPPEQEAQRLAFCLQKNKKMIKSVRADGRFLAVKLLPDSTTEFDTSDPQSFNARRSRYLHILRFERQSCGPGSIPPQVIRITTRCVENKGAFHLVGPDNLLVVESIIQRLKKSFSLPIILHGVCGTEPLIQGLQQQQIMFDTISSIRSLELVPDITQLRFLVESGVLTPSTLGLRLQSIDVLEGMKILQGCQSLQVLTLKIRAWRLNDDPSQFLNKLWESLPLFLRKFRLDVSMDPSVCSFHGHCNNQSLRKRCFQLEELNLSVLHNHVQDPSLSLNTLTGLVCSFPRLRKLTFEPNCPIDLPKFFTRISCLPLLEEIKLKVWLAESLQGSPPLRLPPPLKRLYLKLSNGGFDHKNLLNKLAPQVCLRVYLEFSNTEWFSKILQVIFSSSWKIEWKLALNWLRLEAFLLTLRDVHGEITKKGPYPRGLIHVRVLKHLLPSEGEVKIVGIIQRQFPFIIFDC